MARQSDGATDERRETREREREEERERERAQGRETLISDFINNSF